MNKNKDNSNVVSTLSERLINGLFKENPTFVLLLGMCPTLAVTTSAINGFGMGATTLVVLALSNMMISALRKIIPDKIRIPAFIVIIASFVTIVELLLNAYIPSLYEALGIYIPLIVVNCIILGRAEAYAYSNPVLPSLFDGIGMGFGFTMALTIIGGFREVLGAGSLFGFRVMPAGFVEVSIFVMAPGAFFVLAILTAIQNAVKIAGTKRGRDMSKIQSGCGGNCMECNKECKVEIVSENSEEPESESESVSENTGSDSEASETAVNQDVAESEISKTEESTSESIETVSVSESEAAAPSESTAEVNNKSEETVAESEADKTDNKLSETEKAEAKVSLAESETEPVAEKSPEATEEDELILLDISDLKKAGKPAKKPVRKKSSMAKAKAMLNKADETMKEDK